MLDTTLSFYCANAAHYAADGDVPNPRLHAFLNRCPRRGRILELGSGGGVDAAAILQAGFELDAKDGSSELAAIASHRIGQPVHTMLFGELAPVEEYDGIYACASLTHAPRCELGDILTKVHTALMRGGLVWASFKAGTAEGQDLLGRTYNYLSRDELKAVWHAAAPWASLEVESRLGSGYDRHPTEWIAITAIR
ncbi:methyltransferase domain-containing protein [Oryzibacter oryziterrae]|uniref:methyltransferase domain-containing protein n=1 Tax=Oryzibacter oryziterrae TaxID=2766474 RepID=UPI001F391CE5|nr:class I SAM-dependent methyltransferase [Oryzibacter oryziterrae]